MKDVLKIKNLEQIRLLSDPFKLKLIQSFAEDEKTAKQVATELGESVTRLYRHVDALAEAGLIEVCSETRKRGTIERTFRTTAKQFEADPGLFGPGDSNEAVLAARDLLRAGERELLTSIEQAETGDTLEPLFVRLRVRGSEKRISELRELLTEWLAEVQQESDEETGQEVEVGAMLAFYPLREGSGSQDS